MIYVSDLMNYLKCPRLCYFRSKFKSKLNEMNAVREIYFSLRKGYDFEWARNRFLELGGDERTFEKAKSNFKYSSKLESLSPIEWEIKLESERYKLKGILDELVEFKGLYPLILSLKSSESVRFREKIRIASFCLLLKERGIETDCGFVYYCYEGQLKRVEIGRRERYYTMKLIEKVERVKKGFIPEKGRNVKCDLCEYKEVCESKRSTFLEKFGNKFKL